MSAALGMSVVTTSAATAAPGDEIVVVDQGTNNANTGMQHIRILRQNANWNSAAAQTWSKSFPKTGRWNHLTDVKLRNYKKKKVLLVSSGGGNVGMIDKETREFVWQAQVPGSANAHSIELLPDGQIVVAGSRSGKLYFFPAGSRRSKPYALPGAHGVLYNDNRLWALGDRSLVQYDIHRTKLTPATPPITGMIGGHDLSLIHGTDKHVMWFSDTNKVYTYDKYEGVTPVEAPGALSAFRVKSVGNQLDRTVLQTRPEANRPRPDYCQDFVTPTVNLFTKDGTRLASKTKRGSCFYKARPVVWGYYKNGE